MAKKENIVRYTDKELDAMIARGEDKTDWARVKAKTEEQLAADTASDPAWNGIPEDWYKDAVARTGPLLRPKENKRQVTMRFDADVLEFFQTTGRGWQTRMNAVLRSFMERQR
ncbi:MAG: BrnA antitoxin family protein [Beijerinckiaceae bacterium]